MSERLFEPSKPEVDRRLERAIAEITLPMLEGVRVSPQRLVHMMEHPRCAEFVIGAYVRYPDLEELEEKDDSASTLTHLMSALPAQITKMYHLPAPLATRVTLRDGNAEAAPASESREIGFECAIIQYTQRSDGSLKIRKSTLQMPLVRSSPFTDAELRRWQRLLVMFSGRPGYEKLQALPLILPATAAKLNAFTFTNEDVNLVLQRKAASDSDPFAALASMNFRDLYIKKNELSNSIKQETEELAELKENAAAKEDIDLLDQELAHHRQELDYIENRLTADDPALNLDDSNTKEAPMDHGSFGQPATTGLATGAGGATSASGRDTQWQQNPWVIVPKSLSWRQPMSYLDKLYPLDKLFTPPNNTDNAAPDKDKTSATTRDKTNATTRDDPMNNQPSSTNPPTPTNMPEEINARLVRDQALLLDHFTRCQNVGKRMAVQVNFEFPPEEKSATLPCELPGVKGE